MDRLTSCHRCRTEQMPITLILMLVNVVNCMHTKKRSVKKRKVNLLLMKIWVNKMCIDDPCVFKMSNAGTLTVWMRHQDWGKWSELKWSEVKWSEVKWNEVKWERGRKKRIGRILTVIAMAHKWQISLNLSFKFPIYIFMFIYIYIFGSEPKSKKTLICLVSIQFHCITCIHTHIYIYIYDYERNILMWGCKETNAETETSSSSSSFNRNIHVFSRLRFFVYLQSFDWENKHLEDKDIRLKAAAWFDRPKRTNVNGILWKCKRNNVLNDDHDHDHDSDHIKLRRSKWLNNRNWWLLRNQSSYSF